MPNSEKQMTVEDENLVRDARNRVMLSCQSVSRAEMELATSRILADGGAELRSSIRQLDIAGNMLKKILDTQREIRKMALQNTNNGA